MYDYTVFIGRFQPFHGGHLHVVVEALKQSKTLIMVLGGVGRPRSVRDPFTYTERKTIIRDAVGKLDESLIKRITFTSIRDNIYNDTKWIGDVQQAVQSKITNLIGWTDQPQKIALIGHLKDNTSFYLKMFPQWESIGVLNMLTTNATDIRNEMFETMNNETYKKWDYTNEIIKNGCLDEVKKEFDFAKEYQKQWQNSPYPPVFQTVDAVVTSAGHILVVKRRSTPGKGLIALPGGYIDKDETLLNSMIRELYEETRIDVPKKVLKGSIKQQKTYDAVHRSSRGRIITNAFHIELASSKPSLPKVKGSDDAEKAYWMLISDFINSSDKIFEDHWDIVSDLLGV